MISVSPAEEKFIASSAVPQKVFHGGCDPCSWKIGRTRPRPRSRNPSPTSGATPRFQFEYIVRQKTTGPRDVCTGGAPTPWQPAAQSTGTRPASLPVATSSAKKVRADGSRSR